MEALFKLEGWLYLEEQHLDVWRSVYLALENSSSSDKTRKIFDTCCLIFDTCCYTGFIETTNNKPLSCMM